MALAAILGPLGGAAGTALLQRTFLLDTQTFNGIPKILVVFDAILEESPEYSADVTQHPVESGPEVTDHIQLKNPSLRLKGTISNTPLDLSTTIGNLLSGGLDAITSSQFRANILNSATQQASGIAGAALLGSSANPLGSGLAGAADAIARSIMLDAFSQKKRFDVVTKRTKYESMVIERMSFPRDTQTGFQLAFELELVQIRVVSPFTVNIDSVAENAITSATSKTGLGGQATKAASDQALGATNKSWLRSIVGGL